MGFGLSAVYACGWINDERWRDIRAAMEMVIIVAGMLIASDVL